MNFKYISIGTLIIVMASLIGIVIPLLGVSIVLIPVVIAFYLKKQKRIEIAIAMVVSMTLINIITDPINTLYIFSFGLLNGIGLYYVFEKKFKALDSQIILTVATIVSIIFILSFMNITLGFNINEFLTVSMTESKELISGGGIPLLQSNDIELEMVVQQVSRIIPFILLMMSIMTSSIMYFLYRNILIKLNEDVINVETFSNFKLPKHFIFGTAFILSLSYIVGYLELVNFEVLSINVILIILYSFALQGLAIAFKILDRRKVSKVIKGLFVVLIIVFQGILILSVLGWLDMIFNFRKPKKSE